MLERIGSPTPKFFIKLRNVSLVLAALGGSILAAPVALPTVVLQIASYLAVAGAVGSTVSQAVTPTDEEPSKDEHVGAAFPKD